MNICLLTSSFLPKVGGQEMVVHNLATALTMLGHRVIVITPHSGSKAQDPSYPYKVIRFGFRGSSRFKLTSLLAVSTLYRVVKQFSIDVIHVHDVNNPGSWIYLLKKLNNSVPVVGTPHGDDIQITPEIKDGARLNPKRNKIISRNIKRFDRLTKSWKSE